MKILKPSWVNHQGEPIFSIDIHPDGSRFATAGQGGDNGKIMIWNMQPILEKCKEIDENTPKILCQMDHHMGCVNIVRWSNNGCFLASGSDDKLVMIWQYCQNAFSQNIENWKCSFTLRGHEGDVLDLAWSPKDEYLASCSVDNSVIIWNAKKFPEIVKRINAHSGLVKGVCWDPVSEFIASQSDDKTLKVWRTSDWGLEKCIEEPFKACGGTTHVLRLNWSPDGQFLISAHAMNNGVPTAQVIDRNGWKTKFDLVGHRKAVTSVRFNPSILKHSKSEADKSYCLCAVGSRDRSISIWITQYQRPLSVFHDLFENPIMDLSWSREPIGLLCCSMDGTIAYMQLDYEEVGYPLTRAELENFYKTKYSMDLNETKVQKPAQNEQKVDRFNIIENIDVLLAQEQQQEQNQQQSQEKKSPFDVPSETNSLSNTPLKRNSLVENQKQIERKMADGRRRITPICIAKPGDYEAPKPFGSSTTNEITMRSSTATEQSTIIVEKRDERGDIIEISPVKSIQYMKQSSRHSFSSNSNDMLIFQQIQQKGPVIVDFTQAKLDTTTKAPQTQSQSSTLPQPLKPINESSQQASSITQQPAESSQTFQPPKQPDISKQQTNSTPNTQNKKPANNISANLKPVVAQKTQTPATTTPTTQSVPNKALKRPQTLQTPINLNNTRLTQSQTPVAAAQTQKSITENQQNDENAASEPKRARYATQPLYDLPILKFSQKTSTKIISSRTATKPGISMEISNTLMGNSSLNLAKYNENNEMKWKFLFPSEIMSVACSSRLVSVFTADRLVYLLEKSNGTQMCNPIIVDDFLAVHKCNSNFCLCLTVNGFIYLWKFDSDSNCVRVIVNRQSCEAPFKDATYVNMLLTDNGVPVLQMTNAKSFYYSLETSCWHLVPSTSNFSNLKSYIDVGAANAIQVGPLSLLQTKETNNDIMKAIDKLSEHQEIKDDFTMRHLEAQMNAALGLNSSKEYKFWLLTYARYLSENLHEDKLKQLCSFLLGPMYSIEWNSQIMNLSKRDLLKEVLSIIAKNVSLQRLYSLYKNQLDQQQMMQQEVANETAAAADKVGNSEKAVVNGEMETN